MKHGRSIDGHVDELNTLLKKQDAYTEQDLWSHDSSLEIIDSPEDPSETDRMWFKGAEMSRRREKEMQQPSGRNIETCDPRSDVETRTDETRGKLRLAMREAENAF